APRSRAPRPVASRSPRRSARYREILCTTAQNRDSFLTNRVANWKIRQSVPAVTDGRRSGTAVPAGAAVPARRAGSPPWTGRAAVGPVLSVDREDRDGRGPARPHRAERGRRPARAFPRQPSRLPRDLRDHHRLRPLRRDLARGRGDRDLRLDGLDRDELRLVL